MYLIYLFRLICGTVGFRAEEGFRERFINLCALRNIPLWNMHTNGDTVFACTTLEGYLRIKECAVKSGMRLRHIKASGLPFFLQKYRRRSGLICGFAVFFTVIGILSSMIWTIDIQRNSKVSDEEILAVLEEAGLKVGVTKSSISAPEVRFYALSRLPEVTYLTVNIIGSSVIVEVDEKTEKPDIPTDGTPCDVVSAVDGQVAALELYEGTKLHSVGEAVDKGETLVGGFIELADGSVRFCHAAAYAVIHSQISIISDPEKPTKTLYAKSTEKQTELHIFGLDIPLYISTKPKPDRIRSSYLTVNEKRLPIGYTQRIYTDYAEKDYSRSAQEEKLSTAETYFIKKIAAIGGSEILSEQVNTDGNICGNFTAAVSAGIAKEMMLEQDSTN